MCCIFFKTYSPLLKKADLAPGAHERLQAYGETVIDSVTVGDYDLFLVKTRWMPYPQIGLQKVGRDMTSMEQQGDSTPYQRGSCNLALMKDAILRWAHEYEHLYAASMDSSKTEKYLRLLKLMRIPYTTFDVRGYTVAQI